jgi:hypothetical protein
VSPLISFSADGSWSGSDGCNGWEGTYAVGSVVRADKPLVAATFHATAGLQTLIGCNNVPNRDVVTKATRVAVVNRTLAFYAKNGSELGRYLRT